MKNKPIDLRPPISLYLVDAIGRADIVNMPDPRVTAGANLMVPAIDWAAGDKPGEASKTLVQN